MRQHLFARQLQGRRYALVLVTVMILLFIPALFMEGEKRIITNGNITPVISPLVPPDVDIPVGFGGNPIAFFDDYSWRVFLAMVWPAKTGQRGVADATGTLASNGPRVFETFKADWELFHPDGSSPASDWNSFGDPVPCAVPGAFGFADVALVPISKFGNLGQAGIGSLVGPIVAQNNTYVRYLTGFNKVEFDKILSDSLYLQAKLHNVIFPNGAIDVKSSWIEMEGIQHPERYYTRMAWVLDPVTNVCKQQLVGLVGLHIVQKTGTRPQWIWSTFEQVDNIPQPGAQAPFNFHDAGTTVMPDDNPIPFPPPATPDTVFNIQRLMPVNPSTIQTNASYQDAIRSNGNSVWQFYQLVMTQWPTTPNNPALPGTPPNTFPGTNPTSSFSNITMETFDQKKIQQGCMNCHNFTKSNTDFLWALKVNAFPSIFMQTKQNLFKMAEGKAPKTNPITDKSILQLKELLQKNK